MRKNYCKNCKTPSDTNLCMYCGKLIPASSECNVWEWVGSPLSGGGPLWLAARVMLAAVMAALVVFLALEYIYNPEKTVALGALMTRSRVLPALGQIFLLALGVTAAVLMAQGRETRQYVMEPAGILARTWIEPTKLKCWSRLIPYDERRIAENDSGVRFLMAHEEYIAWKDIVRYKAYRHSGKIKIYHPYAFLFMELRIPFEDFDEAFAMLQKKGPKELRGK